MVQAAPVPVRIVRQQRESPERWHSALLRAIANGLEVFTVADTGERMVTSASRLDALHRTDGRACTCEAALAGDPVCQHRAAVRFALGWLKIEAAAAAPAPDVRPVRPAPKPDNACMWCFGTGRVPNDYQQRFDPCDMCDGARVRRDREPTGNALTVWAGAASDPAVAA